MGNLLSLNPKIHRLRADAKEGRGLPNSQRDFVRNGKGGLCAPRCSISRGRLSEFMTFLYGVFCFFSNRLRRRRTIRSRECNRFRRNHVRVPSTDKIVGE